MILVFFICLSFRLPIELYIFGLLFITFNNAILSFQVPLIALRVKVENLEVGAGFCFFLDRVLTTLFNYGVGFLFGKTYEESNTLLIYSFFLFWLFLVFLLFFLANLFSRSVFVSFQERALGNKKRKKGKRKSSKNDRSRSGTEDQSGMQRVSQSGYNEEVRGDEYSNPEDGSSANAVP